jgi:hypothetical protein
VNSRGLDPASPAVQRDHKLAMLRDHLGKADAYISVVEELIEQPVLDLGDDGDADEVSRRRNHVAHLIESTKLAVRAAICVGDELDNRQSGG